MQIQARRFKSIRKTTESPGDNLFADQQIRSDIQLSGPGPTGSQTRQSQHLKTTTVDVDPITAEILPTEIQGP